METVRAQVIHTMGKLPLGQNNNGIYTIINVDTLPRKVRLGDTIEGTLGYDEFMDEYYMRAVRIIE